MRFTPHTEADRKLMLERIGVRSVEELFGGIPDSIRLKRELNLPAPASEPEVLAELKSLAAENRSDLVCFAGAGAYDHFIPSIVDTIVSRSEFYTAYTPYQAEVSQGTLQAIYEFQSLVCRLFEMEVANASMYDCASALAETCHMARDITKRSRVLVSSAINPRYVEVVRTYAHGLDIPVQEVELDHGTTDLDCLAELLDVQTAAVMVQHPNFTGSLEPMADISRLCHDRGALLVAAVDPISLGVLAPPGSYDADIAVGEGQSLGVPLSFGGPCLGLLATKKQHVRNMPGRLVGRTADIDGRTGYVLALQTREQHIRRERATSNICTNQALCALAATVYLSVMGRTGIKAVAEQCLAKAHYLARGIAGISGFAVENTKPFFKEFVVTTPVPACEVVRRGVERGILVGLDLAEFDPESKHRLLVAVTERRTRQELDLYLELLRTEFAS